MLKTFIKPFYEDAKTFVLDTLFPITCITCQTEGSLICVVCKLKLSKVENQNCIACKKPTPFGLTHQHCLTPHGAEGLISFYNYKDEKVAKIIITGKYYFIPKTFEILGKIISEKIKKDFPNILENKNLILSAVPLHSSRKRWRGFNQAEVLCQAISTELNIPFMETLLRHKITRTQKDLKKEQRVQNVSQAFKFKPKAEILNKTVLLVDDVTTTGATLLEAAKVLKRNYAKKVYCLTVARD